MDVESMIEVVRAGLVDASDPTKAGPMAAYMKTDMPFYGVQKAGRTPIIRRIKREFEPVDHDEYVRAVLALWKQPHREEKYLAIAYARSFSEFITPASMDLYQRLIVEGAWWDFVDEVASKLIGGALMSFREDATPTMRAWVSDDDTWLRRTSIICQLGHKADTDTSLLDDACTANLADTEFFIRKAIGWSLREYAKTEADWVRSYVDDHRADMSALSVREATKHL